MAKDLSTSQIERQNILNNNVALPKIQAALGIEALEYQGVYYVTKQMAADFYEVDLRTINDFTPIKEISCTIFTPCTEGDSFGCHRANIIRLMNTICTAFKISINDLLQLE